MQKVFKSGNSLAVTIPKVYAHELSIQTGSGISWNKTKQGLLLITEKKTKNPLQIDPEVARLIKKISTKYSKVWKDLSKV